MDRYNLSTSIPSTRYFVPALLCVEEDTPITPGEVDCTLVPYSQFIVRQCLHAYRRADSPSLFTGVRVRKTLELDNPRIPRLTPSTSTNFYFRGRERLL